MAGPHPSLGFAVHPHARFYALDAGAIQHEIDDVSTVPIGGLRLRIHILETGETIPRRLDVPFQGVDIDTTMERAPKAFARHDLPSVKRIRSEWHPGDHPTSQIHIVVHIVRQAPIAGGERDREDGECADHSTSAARRQRARSLWAREIDAWVTQVSPSRHGVLLATYRSSSTAWRPAFSYSALA